MTTCQENVILFYGHWFAGELNQWYIMAVGMRAVSMIQILELLMQFRW